MIQNNENLLFNAQYYNLEKFLDIDTKITIDKHLSDKTNKITDEDIRNVKTDIENIESKVIRKKTGKNNRFAENIF